MFRDFAKRNLIERQNKSLEKQTFDLAYLLSDGSSVLIEAKAHQKFNLNQVEQ